MSWWQPHNFEARKPLLKQRMEHIQGIRCWFEEQGFWEVETPALQLCPTVDTHIHAIQADIRGADLKPAQIRYLHTSPEFAMKKLLVAGLPQIYQICHVFRDGEDTRLHSPEFTMIEWYRAGTDYTAIMEDCENLIKSLKIPEFRHNDAICNPQNDWQKLSVAEAFEQLAGLDLGAYLNDTAGFSAAIAAKGIRVADGDNWDDLFFRVMAEKIEPHLGMSIPTILYDYPVSMAALSRKKPSDPKYAERFELYICGVELANAFSELTDAAEQRARFEADLAEKRRLYGESYPMDEDFLRALEYGLPECAGIALGLDRLIMLATGADKLEDVLWAGKP